MAATTPVFFWRYQTLTDPPDGAALGHDLAFDIEATVAAINTTLGLHTTQLGAGYLYQQTVLFTAGGTFSKGAFPGIRAVIVQCQGSGGAGGGANATGVGESSGGAGGKAGSWAEMLILAGSLGASETVTVGVGGTGGTGAGGNGAASTFGAFCSGAGGTGGSVLTNSTSVNYQVGGSNLVGSNTGDRTRPGGDGGTAIRIAATLFVAGSGGEAFYGGTAQGVTQSNPGITGYGKGGGGSGASNGASQSARNGGNGADGLVVVHVYI